MSSAVPRSLLLQRLLAAAILVIAVPLLVGIGAVADEQPVREGEPAPRNVFAERHISFVDEVATDTARRQAAESVDAVFAPDREAQTAVVRDVRDVFESAWAARAPAEDGADAAGQSPTTSAQIETLLTLEPDLSEDLARALVALSDGSLETVERETILIGQELARQPATDADLDAVVEDTLSVELALRSFPGDTEHQVVIPLLELMMRPTVTVDPDATANARERAAEEVEDVTRVWRPGEAIVRTGELVTPVAYRAIGELGLTGGSPVTTWLRATLAIVVLTALAGIYLARMHPQVWRTGKRIMLLALLVLGYTGLVTGASALADATSPGWLYAVPAGALAMLVALLIHPVMGVATMLPASVLVLLVAPGAPQVALFAAAAAFISVPLVSQIAKRSDLRSASLRAGLAYPLLALALVFIFGPRDQWLVALAAGVLNGVITAVVVQGAMPFLETLFRLPTVTALLDLSDRNHPLLRELEAKALGTYNHSVMVASLTERACRAIGADPLLGGVAALYHDIGKVRQPHFFIENQHGIANPHDDLEPRVSAVIIQNHVTDGVEMAIEHRLPPEVVACIGSHHGTMVVSYFYDKAVRDAGGDADRVDEDVFRYRGHKPRSKEAAVLLLADCSEATTRAMAMTRGTLPREDIENTVEQLLGERLEDGQFDESDLTFRELDTVRATIVESLVGVYHPRIAYPGKDARTQDPNVAAPTLPFAESFDGQDVGGPRAPAGQAPFERRS